MENFQQKFNELEQRFNKLLEIPFERYDDDHSDCYQAYYQAYRQFDLTI